MRTNDTKLLQQVVRYLDTHKESERIKKMLYCLCTNRWEKDIDYLNSINSQYLIEQVIREQETLEQLRILLQNLVKTVNKPKHYIQIAKVVYLAIGQLYPEFHQEHSSKSPTSSLATQTPTTSQAYASTSSLATQTSTTSQAYASTSSQRQPTNGSSPTIENSHPNIPPAIERAYAPVTTQADNISQDIHSALHRAYAPAPTQQFEPQAPVNSDIDESAYDTYYDAQMPAEIDPDADVDRSISEYDPFVLRQNVMSYTNPLRAKIILLVMLRPNINFGSQSAAAIREFHLDDLLLETVQTFPTIYELEESMTYAVEQLVEVEEYGKAATGLLQSFAPLYTIGTPGGS
jgi:hypothetical protein